jgi:4'-phosphopantetheinyl transferase
MSGRILLTSTEDTAPLRPDEIRLWCWRLDGAADAAAALLSPAERVRRARFVFPEHARRYALAHAGLRRVLGALAGIAPGDLVFETGAFGKPSLAPGQGGPDLRFNLSHSGDWAALAVAAGFDLGVDIEAIRDVDPALPGQVFSPAEQAELSSVAPASRPAAFFNGWTRKEAHVKAVGQGLSMPLDSFDVTLTPGLPARYMRIGDRPGEAAAWQIAAFEPAPGFAGAVTARRLGWTLRQGSASLPRPC